MQAAVPAHCPSSLPLWEEQSQPSRLCFYYLPPYFYITGYTASSIFYWPLALVVEDLVTLQASLPRSLFSWSYYFISQFGSVFILLWLWKHCPVLWLYSSFCIIFAFLGINFFNFLLVQIFKLQKNDWMSINIVFWKFGTTIATPWSSYYHHSLGVAAVQAPGALDYCTLVSKIVPISWVGSLCPIIPHLFIYLCIWFILLFDWSTCYSNFLRKGARVVNFFACLNAFISPSTLDFIIRLSTESSASFGHIFMVFYFLKFQLKPDTMWML